MDERTGITYQTPMMHLSETFNSPPTAHMETLPAQFITMLMDRIQTLEAESSTQSRVVQSLVDAMTTSKSCEAVVIVADTDEHPHIHLDYGVVFHVTHENRDRFFRNKSAGARLIKAVLKLKEPDWPMNKPLLA